MKYFIILCTLTGLLFLSCHKYGSMRDDVGTKYPTTIGGRLMLYDSIMGNGDTLPLTGKLVTLSYAGSPALPNYLFSAKTDSNGYFLFNGLVPNAKYALNYLDTGLNKIMYQATQPSMLPGNDSLLLLARPAFIDNNGFLYHFTDSTPLARPIAGVNVAIFATGVLLSSDTSLGSIYKLTSDQYGRVSQFDLPIGTYYTLIQTYYPTLYVTRYDTLTITADTGLVVKKIIL